MLKEQIRHIAAPGGLLVYEQGSKREFCFVSLNCRKDHNLSTMILDFFIMYADIKVSIISLPDHNSSDHLGHNQKDNYLLRQTQWALLLSIFKMSVALSMVYGFETRVDIV